MEQFASGGVNAKCPQLARQLQKWRKRQSFGFNSGVKNDTSETCSLGSLQKTESRWTNSKEKRINLIIPCLIILVARSLPVCYCVHFNFQSFMHADCVCLFVSHVWNPRFSLNGIKKYLT